MIITVNMIKTGELNFSEQKRNFNVSVSRKFFRGVG